LLLLVYCKPDCPGVFANSFFGLASAVVGMARCAVPARASQFLAGGSEIPLANAGKAPAGTSQRDVPTIAPSGAAYSVVRSSRCDDRTAQRAVPTADAAPTELGSFVNFICYKDASPTGLLPFLHSSFFIRFPAGRAALPRRRDIWADRQVSPTIFIFTPAR